MKTILFAFFLYIFYHCIIDIHFLTAVCLEINWTELSTFGYKVVHLSVYSSAIWWVNGQCINRCKRSTSLDLRCTSVGVLATPMLMFSFLYYNQVSSAAAGNVHSVITPPQTHAPRTKSIRTARKLRKTQLLSAPIRMTSLTQYRHSKMWTDNWKQVCHI